MKKIILGLWLAAVAPAFGADEAPALLVIDRAHSRVEVAVKATVDSFVATLADYQAEIRVVSGDHPVATATFRFRFSDVKTGKAGRDRHMHEWQQTETFPDGEFTLTSLVPAGDDHLEARGRLRLHGVVRELSFPVSVMSDAKVLAVDGEARVDTREFGLPVIRKFAMLKVDPVVVVRFHLQGVRPALNGDFPR